MCRLENWQNSYLPAARFVEIHDKSWFVQIQNRISCVDLHSKTFLNLISQFKCLLLRCIRLVWLVIQIHKQEWDFGTFLKFNCDCMRLRPVTLPIGFDSFVQQLIDAKAFCNWRKQLFRCKEWTYRLYTKIETRPLHRLCHVVNPHLWATYWCTPSNRTLQNKLFAPYKKASLKRAFSALSKLFSQRSFIFIRKGLVSQNPTSYIALAGDSLDGEPISDIVITLGELCFGSQTKIGTNNTSCKRAKKFSE